MKVTSTIKYPKAIFSFVAAILLFVIGTDIYLFTIEQKRLYTGFENDTKAELALIGAMVTDPMLENRFDLVEEFVLLWGKTQTDTLQIQAISPNGFVLADVIRTCGTVCAKKTFFHSVHFMDQHLLDLKVTKNLSKITNRSQQFLEQFIV